MLVCVCNIIFVIPAYDCYYWRCLINSFLFCIDVLRFIYFLDLFAIAAFAYTTRADLVFVFCVSSHGVRARYICW